jgi:small subunit ribosomal protein S1
MVENQQGNKQSKFAALLESTYEYIRPRRGEVREAVILSIGENDMLVDLGGKRDGIVPPSDLEMVNEDYVADLEVGDNIPVKILRPSRRYDAVPVSLKKGLEQQDWLRAEEMLESGKIFEAEVEDVNRGGVLVSFGGLRGFVPNSHLTSIPYGLRGNELREAKEELVGEVIPLVVIDVNQRRRRLVLSERVAGGRRRQQLLEELMEGDIRKGTVRNLVDFGAFVDLGGIDGLIHISELSWDYVEHPKDVLDVGDKVEVYVLNVDRERKRIGLSRKRVIPADFDQKKSEAEEEEPEVEEPEVEEPEEEEPEVEEDVEVETETEVEDTQEA